MSRCTPSPGRLYAVAILASHLPTEENGGAERQALRTATELARRGYHPSLFVRGPATRVRCGQGVRVIERHELLLGDRLAPIRFVADIMRAIGDLCRTEGGFDVVLSYNTMICGLIGAIYSVATGTPLVLWIRGEGEYRHPRGMKGRVLAPLAWLGAKTILVQTPTIAAEFVDTLVNLVPSAVVARITHKVQVMPNGLDLPSEATPPSRERELLFVGRLVQRKGIEHLIRALPAIPGARLTIVGEGADRPRLEALASGLPVSFVGFKAQPELNEYYRRATLLVLPSLFGEGLPNAVLEAMACGRPVVITRIAGAVDIVQDGINGRLVEPGNPDALAAAIRSLLEAPTSLDMMGVAARETAGQYTWDALMPKLERALSATICSRTGVAGSGHDAMRRGRLQTRFRSWRSER